MNSKLWRLSHGLYMHHMDHAGRVIELMYNIICGNSISTKIKIGGGTIFYHHGVGCVVHELCSIGEDCKIFGNVTIGCKWSGGDEPGLPPTIGNHVLIGAGAAILGNIHVGDNAIIGANAVVLTNIPAGCIAVGNPARIISGN